MRTCTLFLALGAAALVLTACTGSKETDGPERIVAGTIATIGNEPFTRLAVRVDAGTMISLKCDKETSASLMANQGKRVKIHFKRSEQKPDGLFVTVLKAELVDKN